MRRLLRSIFTVFVTVALMACSNTARQPDRAGAVCIESSERVLDPGPIVVVDTEDDPALPSFISAWAYAPSAITARVGEVIDFRNRDPDSQHTAELDSGACGTDYLDFGSSDGLIFKLPGSYPFHCLVHGTAMVGTITILR